MREWTPFLDRLAGPRSASAIGPPIITVRKTDPFRAARRKIILVSGEWWSFFAAVFGFSQIAEVAPSFLVYRPSPLAPRPSPRHLRPRRPVPHVFLLRAVR